MVGEEKQPSMGKGRGQLEDPGPLLPAPCRSPPSPPPHTPGQLLSSPQFAHFPCRRIRAGTELTWDYNYEVGSVEGKELLCCCGAIECRGRLL